MHNAILSRRLKAAFACGTLALIIVAANTNAGSARSVAEDLPLLGNTLTGSPFSRTCPDNHVLTGFRYRSGLILDGIGPIKCRPVQSDGTLGAEVLAGSLAGGNGGTLANKSCGANQVVAGQQSGLPRLASLTFFCMRWSATSKAWFGTGDVLALFGGAASQMRQCSSSTQPATGIRGRHGMVIDAIGLVCSSP